MQNPLVSVLMPAYNADKFIYDALNSIINQTYKNIEIIIINDGSNDNTTQEILKLEDNRIKLITNAKNLGIVKSLNKGLEICKGKYIARMDADDISLPNRIETQVRFMEKHKLIDVCGTWMEYFGNTSEIGKVPVKHKFIKAKLLFGNSIFHPTVMFRSCVKIKYSDDHTHLEDYFLWHTLKNKVQFYNIPKPLVKYRTEEQNITFKNRESLLKRKTNLFRIILQELNINATPKELSLHYGIIKSIEDFEQYMSWAAKIEKHNNKCKIYNRAALQKHFHYEKNKQFYKLVDVNPYYSFNYWKIRKYIRISEVYYFISKLKNRMFSKFLDS